MDLLTECLSSLEGKYKIITKKEADALFYLFESEFSMRYGRINWSEIENKFTFTSIEEVIKYTQGKSKVFVLWDNASLPVLKVDLNEALYNIDDIKAVSFDTWLLCEEFSFLIELYHEGEYTIGLF